LVIADGQCKPYLDIKAGDLCALKTVGDPYGRKLQAKVRKQFLGA